MNENILPNDELATIAFIFMLQNYKKQLVNRYNYLDFEANVEDNFRLIAQKRGYLAKGGEDVEKAYKVFLNELKNGVLGPITFERVPDNA